MLLVVWYAMLLTCTLFAHRGLCGTRKFNMQKDYNYESAVANEAALRRGRRPKHAPVEMINVDVIFHIIQSGNKTIQGNVPDSVIKKQMMVLCKDYKNIASLNLKMINRVTNKKWFGAKIESKAESEMKEALRIGGSNVLNVYTVKGNDEIAGWASLPADYDEDPKADGVVLNFNTLPGGKLEPNNKGRTLTHESGHWFGLLHPFDEGCSYPNDLVEDTPPQSEPNYFCPMKVEKSCQADDFMVDADKIYFSLHDFHSEKTDSPRNFMDYIDDECMEFFTPGQIQRMREQWMVRSR